MSDYGVKIAGPITEPHQISVCLGSALHCHMHEGRRALRAVLPLVP